jgi:MSHA pilin protein MshD
MCIEPTRKPLLRVSLPHRTQGFSLVEVVLFILVVSVALVAVLNAFNLANVGSADPMLRRQSLAIGQALLEEISFKPFGNAATDDPGQGGFAGPYTSANRARFDDMDDYNGFTLNGIRTLDNVEVSGLTLYQVSVAVVNAAFGNVPDTHGKRVTVTVTDPANNTLVLETYRADY